MSNDIITLTYREADQRNRTTRMERRYIGDDEQEFAWGVLMLLINASREQGSFQLYTILHLVKESGCGPLADKADAKDLAVMEAAARRMLDRRKGRQRGGGK